MQYRNHTFIVRNLDQRGKHIVNTKDLIAALKAWDEARSNGIASDLSCKDKGSYVPNQLLPVPKDWIDEARQEM